LLQKGKEEEEEEKEEEPREVEKVKGGEVGWGVAEVEANF
jgi:hypothetical protein